jgi:hypothetical protein
MRCVFCRKGPNEGVSLYRINAKGQTGVWACDGHIGQTDAAPIPPAVKRLADVFSGKTQTETEDEG